MEALVVVDCDEELSFFSLYIYTFQDSCIACKVLICENAIYAFL